MNKHLIYSPKFYTFEARERWLRNLDKQPHVFWLIVLLVKLREMFNNDRIRARLTGD